MARRSRSRVLARLAEEPRSAIPWILGKSAQKERIFSEFLEMANAEVDADPVQGKRLAQIAVRLAVGLDPASQARALDCLANAHRALGSYAKSKKALDLALARAGGDPALLSLLERRLAHWWGSQGKHDVELLHLERSLLLARRAGDRESEGRSLFLKAVSLDSVGESEAARRVAKAALARLSPGRSARFRAAAQHVIAASLAKSGSFAGVREALAELPKIRAQLKGKHCREATMERAKIWWLEALLLQRVGAHHKAEELLRRALRWFLKLEMPQEIAALTADLVMINSHDRAKVREIVRPVGQAAKRGEIRFPAEVASGLSNLWRSTQTDNVWEHTKPEKRRLRVRRIHEAAQALRALAKDDRQIPVNFLPVAKGLAPLEPTSIGF